MKGWKRLVPPSFHPHPSSNWAALLYDSFSFVVSAYYNCGMLVKNSLFLSARAAEEQTAECES